MEQPFTMTALVLRLNEAPAIEAHHEYPGFIALRWQDSEQWIEAGRAAGWWQANLTNGRGEVTEGIDLDDTIPADCEDMERIAHMLIEAAFTAHRAEDPHCTCNDCVSFFFEPIPEVVE